MELELHFACSGLKNVDVGSLTDSAAVVYLRSGYKSFKISGRGQYKFVGKTETITDNLNPVYVQSVVINYLFEEKQDIRIAVYQIDDLSPQASAEQKLIGVVDLHVHDIVTSPGGKIERPLVEYDQE